MTLDTAISEKRMGGASALEKRQSGCDRKDFTWHRQPAGAWALHCVGRREVILHVIPDAEHPRMCRIRAPDGRLSDMANITWARDGAIGAALRTLNRQRQEIAACRHPPIATRVHRQ